MNDKPPIVTNVNFVVDITLYECWGRSNRLSVMFIKTKIYPNIHGLVDHHVKVRDLLKAIDKQFETSNKTLISTHIMKFSSIS